MIVMIVDGCVLKEVLGVHVKYGGKVRIVVGVVGKM